MQLKLRVVFYVFRQIILNFIPIVPKQTKLYYNTSNTLVDEFFMIFDYIFFSGLVIRIIDKNEANSIVKQQQQQQGDEISELQLLSAAVSRIMRDTDGVHYHYLSSKKKIQF